MTFEEYNQKFRAVATQSGYSEENIVRCLQYSKPLIEKGIPVIYNTANLSALVGYKKGYLKRAALFTEYFYRNFSILKKNGRPRNLKEPLPSLKEIQYWILKNILYEIPVSKYAKAYIKGKSLIENVKYHKGKETVVTLDIRDFFSSIKLESIENIFLSLGYSSNISNLLAKLCCCDGFLPQGAPTSPYLSNIYMIDFDAKVSQFCNKLNIRYTRYADDITFSGTIKDAEELVSFCKDNLELISLSLNETKMKVMGKNVRQIVTGILVNEKIQIARPYRDKIRQEIYFIKKFGIDAHLQHTKNTRSNYIPHLLGKINYVLDINPNDLTMRTYKEFLLNLR